MIAKVIPFARLPRRLGLFDYLIPQNLENHLGIGHIVVVSFRKQKKYCVVCAMSDGPKEGAAALLPIVSATAMALPEKFVKLISWMAGYYVCSPSLFYKLFIPPPPGRQISSSKPAYESKKLMLSKNEAANVIAALKDWPEKKEVFVYQNNLKETAAIFLKLVQKALRGNKQALLLVPSPEDLNYFVPFFTEYFKEKLVIWKSGLTKNECFQRWFRVLNGESCVVLGTRTAIFLPFDKLSLILTHNASSPDYKQWDLNPRYDTRKITQEILRHGQTQVVLSDILPNLNIYHDMDVKKVAAVNSPSARPRFTLLDLRKEKKNIVPVFSSQMHQLIADAALQNKQVVIFLNRQEKDSALFCQDCSQVFKCAACQRPYDVDNAEIFCYHCKSKKEAPLVCEKCGGGHLKTLLMGANTLKKIINKEYPSLRVAIFSAKRRRVDDFDVLIATDAFWKSELAKENRARTRAIIIADFDVYLTRPDLNQKETALLSLERFLRFGKNIAAEEILVQTSCPDSSIFQSQTMAYDEELKEREELGYPPFKKLVKIICKASNQNQLQEKTMLLYNQLLRAGYTVLPPFEPLIGKRTRHYFMHIILKTDLNQNVDSLRLLVPDNYQIDTDPISFV